jgi:16S rRNA (adenine1518-N6/adenine1519-N6)-dimethyltransferase
MRPRNHTPFARKRFAQHFLVQAGTAERIVELAGLHGTEAVLEIGPGRGALTGLLASRCRQLVLIEVDRDLAADLRQTYASSPVVRIIEGDVLEIDLPALLGGCAPMTVVANLPYNISTPVLMRLLGEPELFARLVLMLQREVAERLCATPGRKVYGALSVVVQTVAEARIAMQVPPGAFAPRPKVDSAVVVIEPRRPTPLGPPERRALRTVVRTAFSRRRKQLANVIAPLTPDPHAVLERLRLDPRCRPETLAPDDFVRLAQALRPAGTHPTEDTDDHR